MTCHLYLQEFPKQVKSNKGNVVFPISINLIYKYIYIYLQINLMEQTIENCNCDYPHKSSITMISE